MPGPIPDECIFLNPGSPNFWESEDILLNPAPIPGDPTLPGTRMPGVANVGKNLIRVNVRKRQECGVSGPVLVDVFVCNPSVGVVPPRTTTPKPSLAITNKDPLNPDTFIPNAANINGVEVVRIIWEIAAGVPATEPDGPGHRCLVARCYPDSGSVPDPSNFFVQTGPGLGDPHVVQKNIDISAGTVPLRHIGFNAANFSMQEPERLTLRATAVLQPAESSLAVLLPMLRHVPGFQRIATKAPKSFAVTAPDVRESSARDRSRPGFLDLFFRRRTRPAFELDIQLEPGQLAGCFLDVDLTDSAPGDAHVFKLTQATASGAIQGGLTIVAVRE